MQNGFKDCDDPKKLLLPGTLPIPVHTIINRTDEAEKEAEELPSTIDMDALKVLDCHSRYCCPSEALQNDPKLKVTSSMH